MDKHVYIGVDPGGSSGAICFLVNNYPLTYSFKKMTESSLNESFLYIKKEIGLEIEMYGIIERVWAMPKQGVTSSFHFGMNYGMMRAFLVAHRVSFISVLPREWQKHFSMTKKKSETQIKWKRRLWEIAQNIYPNSKIKLNEADAVLIATYCKYLKK